MMMMIMVNNKRTPEEELDHVGGCPGWAECCTEYGYCHPKVFFLHDDDYHDTDQVVSERIWMMTCRQNNKRINTGFLGSWTVQGLQWRKQRKATSTRFNV